MNPKTLRYITDKMAFCAKALNKLRLYPLSIFVFKTKDKIVLNYLYKHYNNFIQNYKPSEIFNKKTDFEKSPVWVCWLQGEENAPELVKRCISSIRENSNGHPVVIITNDNIKDFVDMPSFILENCENSVLSRTSFSDIVRSYLLAVYGGMWIDATFFITQKLPDSYFEYSIFSGAKQPEPKDRRNVCISRYRWTGSFIGAAKPNNLLFCFLSDFFTEYEKREIVFIDYLLIDYLIFIAYQSFPSVKEEIDNIPDNNLNFGWLFHSMNKKYIESDVIKNLYGKTLAFKLSYKINWKLFKGKHETIYKKFINGELPNSGDNENE